MRPAKLAGDLATTEACFKHALITYEKITNVKFDLEFFWVRLIFSEI